MSVPYPLAQRRAGAAIAAMASLPPSGSGPCTLGDAAAALPLVAALPPRAPSPLRRAVIFGGGVWHPDATAAEAVDGSHDLYWRQSLPPPAREGGDAAGDGGGSGSGGGSGATRDGGKDRGSSGDSGNDNVDDIGAVSLHHRPGAAALAAIDELGSVLAATRAAGAPPSEPALGGNKARDVAAGGAGGMGGEAPPRFTLPRAALLVNFIHAAGEVLRPPVATAAAVAALAGMHYRLSPEEGGDRDRDGGGGRGSSGGGGLSAMDAAINDVVRLLVVHTLLTAVSFPDSRRAIHAGKACALPTLAASPSALRAIMGVDVGSCVPSDVGRRSDMSAHVRRCVMSPMALDAAQQVSSLACRPLLDAVPDAPERLVAALPTSAGPRLSDAAREWGCVAAIFLSLAYLAGVDSATLSREPATIGTVSRAYTIVERPRGRALDEWAASSAAGGPQTRVSGHISLYLVMWDLLSWVAAVSPRTLVATPDAVTIIIDRAAAEVEGRLVFNDGRRATGCALLSMLVDVAAPAEAGNDPLGPIARRSPPPPLPARRDILALRRALENRSAMVRAMAVSPHHEVFGLPIRVWLSLPIGSPMPMASHWGDRAPSPTMPRLKRDGCIACGLCERDGTETGNRPPTGPSLRRCGRCRLAAYCGRACQVTDWAAHKRVCATWKAMRPRWMKNSFMPATFTPGEPRGGENNWVAPLASDLLRASGRLVDWVVVHWASVGLASLTPVSVYRACSNNPVDVAALDAAAATAREMDVLRVVVVAHPQFIWVYVPSGEGAQHDG